jgi:hypothetical protein
VEWVEYKRWLRGVIHDVWHPTKLRLRRIHNEIAKHTPSPFSNKELIRWGIKPKPVKRKPRIFDPLKPRIFDPLLKKDWSTPSLTEIPYTPELKALYQKQFGMIRRI